MMMSTIEPAAQTERKQMGNLDVLRVLAALAVVCIHVVSAPVHAYEGVLRADLANTLETIHALMNWSVPVFFILTGYFCGRHATYTYAFAWKKARKFIIVLFTVGLFYGLLECVFATNHLGFYELKTAFLNVLNRNLWDHMWFVYDIIGIYLVLPLLFLFFKKANGPREQGILVFLLFLMNILLPWIGVRTAVNIVIKFQLGAYLYYVCFGMLFSTCSLARISRRTRIIFSAVLILAGILGPLLGIGEQSYTDLFVCFLASGLFVLFLELRIPATKGMAELAACTWGVYLIHPFFINLAIKFFKIELLTGVVFGKMVGFYLAVTAISFLATFVLRRIPVIKALF